MELSRPNVSPRALYDMVFESDRSQVLRHGIDFKVFDHLAELISAEEVASRLGTEPDATSRLLDMLAIMEMIEKADGRYVNTQVAEEFLVTGRPTYLGDFMQVSLDEYARMAAQIPMSLKNGIESQMIPEEQWSGWSEMTIRGQLAMWTSKVLPLVMDIPEFSDLKRMLDLAGNAGIYTVALVSHHPTLEEICKKVYQAMNPGGVFVSQQQMVIGKNRIWPPDTAWLSHIMAFGGLDCTLYETDVSDAMLRAGFGSVESRYVEYANGTNRVDIARK